MSKESMLTPEEILGSTADDFGEERALPTGHWQLQITKAKVVASKSESENAPKSSFIAYSRPVKPLDDVNEAELENFDYTHELASYEIPIFVSKDQHKIRRFAETLGIETGNGSKAGQWADAMKGATYVGEVYHQQRVNVEPGTLPLVKVRSPQAIS